MSAVLEDYISQEFDPFLGLMRAQLARPPYLDWQTAVPEGSFVQLRSALPGSPSVESLTADMFVDETPDLFGDRVPGLYVPSGLGGTWNTVTYDLLERDPDVRPIWDDLLAVPNPYTAWRDFRSSTEFQPTVETLGKRGRGLLGRARGLLEKGLKFAKTARILTPTGAALYLAGVAADELVVAGAKWLWKNRDALDPPWKENPRPPVRPPRVLGFEAQSSFDLGPYTAPIAERWMQPPTTAVPEMLMSIGGMNGVYR